MPTRLMPLRLAMVLLLSTAPTLGVQALMNCTFTSPTLNFGAVDVLNGTYPQTSVSMSVTCTKGVADIGTNGYLCLNVGDGSAADPVRGSRNAYQPRLLSTPTNYMGWQLYQDPSYATFWGTYAPNGNPLRMYFNFSGGRTVTQTLTLYGKLADITPPALGGTSTLNTVRPGNYSSSFAGSHTRWDSTLLTTQTPDTYCNPRLYNANGTFPFNVSASVPANCKVQATNTIDFGTQLASATNLQNSGALQIACTRTTPYFIGLRPSNNDNTGAGVMSGTGGNTDQIPYQLRQAAGLSATIWGNTATSVSAGNGIGGTGTGVAQGYTVFATVPALDFTPDTYTDTVTVTVNY